MFRAPTSSDRARWAAAGEWVQAGAGIPGSGNFCKGGNAAMGISATGPQACKRSFPSEFPQPGQTLTPKYCRPRFIMVKHREGDLAGGGVDTRTRCGSANQVYFPVLASAPESASAPASAFAGVGLRLGPPRRELTPSAPSFNVE